MDIEYIKDQYMSGRSSTAIGKDLNVSGGLVRYYLRKYNIKIRKNKEISEEVKTDICSEYKNGVGATIIKRKHNICVSEIYYILKANNIPIRSKINYYHNENYFQNVNEQVCQWAGFIAADGCLFEKRKSLQFGLASKDICILEQFRSDIDFNGKINKIVLKNNYEVVRLTIYDNRIYNDLIDKFNITPRKSLTLKHPNLLEINHIGSFIVGLINGDGSIYLNDDYIYLRILGTKDICMWIRDFYFDLMSLPKSDKYIAKKENIYTFSLSSKNAYMFLKKIRYYNCFYLDRKWSIFDTYETKWFS